MSSMSSSSSSSSSSIQFNSWPKFLQNPSFRHWSGFHLSQLMILFVGFYLLFSYLCFGEGCLEFLPPPILETRGSRLVGPQVS
ncbi:hypothetical protein Scep_013476 [Stephania cephalantha]|uniref:Uncharacterized protein n=1 Tax=Stephania cephalantha TaxID=152367 RepID=A0AAP0JH55_9MAGN